MKIFIVYGILLTCICLLSYRQVPDDNQIKINSYYTGQLGILKSDVELLKQAIEKKSSVAMQQNAFQKTRITYKKLSVLTDFLSPYETILLNSAALERTEDDNPTNIVEPHGFQQIESLLWTTGKATDNNEKLAEISHLEEIITALENEPDRINKFTDAMVWEAIRSSIITITTKTITGFDSPVAQLSIEECKAMLEGMAEIISIYQPILNTNAIGYYDMLANGIADAVLVLSNSKDFNSFDRLSFLKNNINPISNHLTEVAIKLNFINSNERRPVNPTALNLFAKNAFDINFFSPNKRYQFTPQRMLLGKKLFNDAVLSGNGLRSCESCHKPELAFTDGLQKAMSLDNKTVLKRNTPTLLNAVFQTRQFYDSRETMLEFQISNVVHNEKEMGGSIENVAQIIKQQKDFSALFAIAYPDERDPVNVYTIANAIGSYLRSLQSMNSKFDQYMRNEAVTFSASEKNGFNLFMGKAKCATCHFIPLFNGLVPPQFSETESEVIGVPASTKKPAQLDADSGKYYFTKSLVHLYAFKTPSLRNIALTAPYMHNGIYKSLEEVIDFYNTGGGKGLGISPTNQSLPFDKLNLSKLEKKDIINFLFTLTDTTSYKTIQ